MVLEYQNRNCSKEEIGVDARDKRTFCQFESTAECTQRWQLVGCPAKQAVTVEGPARLGSTGCDSWLHVGYKSVHLAFEGLAWQSLSGPALQSVELWGRCRGDSSVCVGECDKFQKLNMKYKVTNSHLPSPYLMMLNIRQGKSRTFQAVL